MPGRRVAALFLFVSFAVVIEAKGIVTSAARLVTSSFYFTLGGTQLKDTYLSIIPYKGFNIGIGAENMRISRFKKHKWNTRHLLEADFSNVKNSRKNTNMLSAMLTYEFSFYRRFEFPCSLQLLAGGDMMLDAGCVYNGYNSNNPASAKASLGVGIAGMALYKIKFKNYHINLRYSISAPMAEVFFCPQFGASYYEMFSLGNRQGWMHFGSLHNQMIIHNMLTFDFPVGRRYLRIGYEGKFRSMHENYLVYKSYTNSLILGITLQSVLVSGRNNCKRGVSEYSAQSVKY